MAPMPSRLRVELYSQHDPASTGNSGVYDKNKGLFLVFTKGFAIEVQIITTHLEHRITFRKKKVCGFHMF